MVAPLLVFRVGAAQAANLLLRAHSITASQAQCMGFVHELTSADMNWVRSFEMVQEIAKNAPESMQTYQEIAQ